MFVSFEVDTLEIVLRELEDIVDTFFLVESNGTHKGVIGLSSTHSAQGSMYLELTSRARPECPVVGTDWFFTVSMLLLSEHCLLFL